MRALFRLAAVLVFGGCAPAPPSTLLPAPLHGVQLQMGPFDVPIADLTNPPPPGVVPGEVQLCRTLKLDTTERVAFNRIQVAMNEGSHHFILFRSQHDFPDQIFPCWGTVNFDDWEFMVDVNRTGGEDWELAPGQAFVLEPHQQLMMQVHFVNASSVQTPLGGQVTANLHSQPIEEVVHELHGKFIVNTEIDIAPGAAYTTPVRICTFSHAAFVTSMTGHFHARGTLFEVHKLTPLPVGPPPHNQPRNIDEGMLYTSDSWDAPPFVLFDPTPRVSPKQGLGFRCSYFNKTANPIGWGSHADTQEHCNLFFQYYDAQVSPEPLACIEGSGGW